MTDPVPDGARVEIERLVRRWVSLPLDRALVVVPQLRARAQSYADEAAAAAGLEPVSLPELGPASVLDQLVVTVYDVCATADAPRLEGIASELAQVRRIVGDA